MNENDIIGGNDTINEAKPAEEQTIQLENVVTDTPNSVATQPKKEKKKRIKGKERRKLWKQHKKDARAQLKQDYQYAPFLLKFWKLYLRKATPFIIIATFIFSFFGVFLIAIFAEELEDGLIELILAVDESYHEPLDDPAPIYKESPLDKLGASRIDTLPAYGADDTWTFCVYIVGANLEDMDENDLSELTMLMTAPEAQAAKEKTRNNQLNCLQTYRDELAANNLDCPEYLYKINKPIASSETVTNDVIVAQRAGCASMDIAEMVWGSTYTKDRVKIVIQTGGATRWSDSSINPNKTQRFLCQNGTFEEIANLPLQDSCNPDTLTDFLEFCNNNYKSDHMAVILWDHGGGIRGFGSDDIFETTLTLNDLHKAFDNAVKKDEENPPYDFIGYDACLMATIEAIHTFNGYTKYMAVSEESEPGYGWDYETILKLMGNDPTMNAAKVCQAIADSYTDYYMTENVRRGYAANAITFSVIDVAEAEKTYDAYCELNKTLLKDVLTDPTNMTTISRVANRATKFGGSAYDYFNEIDLGVYMDYLSQYYPEECEPVRTHFRNAVLYNRQNDYLADAQGISVYFPASINDAYGLMTALQFIYDTCDDEPTKALLYYKISGCLNDDMKKYAKSIGCTDIKLHNTELYKTFEKSEIVFDEGMEYHIPLNKDLEDFVQGGVMELATYTWDEDTGYGTLTYYGTDNNCYLDGNGNLATDFDGYWFTLDGVTLSAEFIGESDSGVMYRSRIKHNGIPSYLTFTYNKDTEALNLQTVTPIPDPNSDMIADVSTKNATELEAGDTIVPIYVSQDLSNNQQYDSYGSTIRFKESSKLKLKKLDNANYTHTIFISDTRGDSYYSPVVEFVVEGGKIKDVHLSEMFVGEDN